MFCQLVFWECCLMVRQGILMCPFCNVAEQWSSALKYVVFVLAEADSAATTTVPRHIRDYFSVSLLLPSPLANLYSNKLLAFPSGYSAVNISTDITLLSSTLYYC